MSGAFVFTKVETYSAKIFFLKTDYCDLDIW